MVELNSSLATANQSNEEYMKTDMEDTKVIAIHAFGSFAQVKDGVLFVAPMNSDGTCDEDNWAEVEDLAPGFFEAFKSELNRNQNK
jgi:hypothetical protein